MKIYTFLFTLLTATFFLATIPSYAQTDTPVTPATTIKSSQTPEENLKAEANLNKERKDDAKALKKEYRAKAKEAKRVERDAAYASKQADRSELMERRAQKARSRAEKQSKKATKAAEKSDNN